MKLAIDIGNSLIKWAVRENLEWVQKGSLSTSRYQDLKLVIEQTDPQSIYVANVSHPNISQFISFLTSPNSIPVYFFNGKTPLPPLVNHYQNPLQLGVDRWLSMFAARQITTGNVLVINSGTATTIDALTEHHEFLGGIIIPGLDLMVKSLHQGTAQIGQHHGEMVTWPTNSGDALTSGAIEATLGAIEHRYNQFTNKNNEEVAIILSGGNRELISTRLHLAHRVIENLTLEGIGISIDQQIKITEL